MQQRVELVLEALGRDVKGFGMEVLIHLNAVINAACHLVDEAVLQGSPSTFTAPRDEGRHPRSQRPRGGRPRVEV